MRLQRFCAALEGPNANNIVSGDVNVTKILQIISTKPEVLVRAKQVAPLFELD
ncbi:hypothetical protein QQX98_009503 [Neonectria punicea]|uniref:Uncharacterized protein n=1 Tax=Neonectria punicea TaxID=979145 RepID=A0ABR1GS09_9HYPO